jgi:hypothetical protein
MSEAGAAPSESNVRVVEVRNFGRLALHGRRLLIHVTHSPAFLRSQCV